MTKRNLRQYAAALAAILSLSGVSGSALALVQAAAAPAAAPDAAAVQALVASIDAQIAQFGGNGSADDYQGAIAFAIDQAQASSDVVSAALKAVMARPNVSKALSQALNSVMANYASSGTGGTGGTGGTAGTAAQSTSALSAGPSIGGGGSAAYSNP